LMQANIHSLLQSAIFTCWARNRCIRACTLLSVVLTLASLVLQLASLCTYDSKANASPCSEQAPVNLSSSSSTRAEYTQARHRWLQMCYCLTAIQMLNLHAKIVLTP
jgi:hypothetical protein